ncbi:MAG: glycosyltransferase family 4 protein [Mangrovicoccus sp.]|nr:glycosyltransferase family 4 protein [Mangrovicoccus sp.]
MVILHVCETAKGGVGSYLNIFADQDRLGARSILVLPEQHADQIDPRLKTYVFNRSGRGPVPVMRLVQTALKAARAEKPDVIFFHSTFALSALIMFRMAGIKAPKIYCSHGWAVSRYDHSPRKAALVRAVEGRLCGLADVTVNISQADLNLAQELGYRGTHCLIENAVAPPKLPAAVDLFDPSHINLLFVGRLDRQKGVDILLQAWAQVARMRDDLRLHIVGSGVNNDGGYNIEQAENVFLHGWVDRDMIDAYYRSADALIVPSRWEGFGLVVPEAFRNGTPALVSRAGALPDLVTEGRTGHIFEADVEAIANCLMGINKSSLAAMESACLDSYETRFHQNRFAQDFTQLFAALLPAQSAHLKARLGKPVPR